jgi:hypothetical protein
VVAGLAAAAGSPAASAAGPVEETNCNGIQAQIPVPPENVDPVVPNQPGNENDFRLKLGEVTPGTATVLVGAVHCEEMAIAGISRETRFVTLRVLLEDPDTSDAPGPGRIDGGHQYMLWIASDNPDLIALYRAQGVMPPHAVHMDDLVVDVPAAELPFGRVTVSAPSAPSPFELTADVGSLVLGPLNVTVDHWKAVPRGTMEQRPDDLDLVRLGGVENGQVLPQAASEMDTLFCAAGRLPGDPVSFSGEAGLTGSFRLSFVRGRFPVDLNETRKPSATTRAACSPSG